jgi:hypothetical protein
MLEATVTRQGFWRSGGQHDLRIYDEDLREAKNTLKHEYLDCLLTRKIVEPLIAIVNTFIKLKEGEVHKEKEQIVSTLSKLI